MMKNLRVFYTLGICFLMFTIISAQTTVINPTAEGGFELGSTFADNGWTVVNGSATSTQNQWILGLSTATGVGTGNCAYITNNTGTAAYAYTNNSAMYVVHFYRDVVIPANETKALLSFKWKCVGETGVFDGIQVSVAPTSVTPTASSTAPSGAVTGPIVPNAFVAGNFLYFGQSTTNTSTVLLPVGAVGPCNSPNTVRLIFTFRLDGSLGTSPGAAIDDISLITSSTNISSMGGTYTIDNTLPTSGTNFANFTDAISELNAVSFCGLTGPIQFNVTAGQTFNENVPFITATGSAVNNITFVKSGMGANPVIKPTGSAGSTDFGIGLNGSDYIIFDGIDVDASAVSAVEYGYYIINSSATNGAQNNTIRNTSITLNRTNTSSRAIYQNVANTPTSAAGANSFNKFYNLTISNSYVGCYLLGNSTFPDLSCEIGTTSPTLFNQIGNPGVPNDIGNGSSTTWGIRGTSQSGLKVYNNQIFNLTVTSGVTCSGIFVENGQGNIEIYRNKIQDLKSTSTSTSAILYGIRSDVNSGGISVISNNFISGFTHAITTASSTVIIRALASNIGSNAGTNKFYHNTVLVNLTTTAASSATAHLTSGTAELRNNILVNLSPGAATSKRYTINKVGGTMISNNNDLFVVSGTNNFIGFNVADQATFANWKASSGSPDLSSFNINPSFVSATDLHLNYGITPNEFESGGADVAITNITTDYDNQARPGPSGSVNGGAIKPDLGADEFDGVIFDQQAPSIEYIPLTFTCLTGDRTLSNVSIIDLSGVPTTGALMPRIYYAKKPAGGSLGAWNSQQGSISTGTGQSGVWSFNIIAADMGGLVASDTVFYYIIAQDIVSPTPNITSNPIGAVATDVNTVSSPPTTPNKFLISGTLSGNYNVGSGGDFNTLTSAVNAYNNSCLSGPVTFTLTDAAYSTNETFPISINSNSTASSTNTLTIKPATGVNSLISGSTATLLSVLKLNGSDYVIINGLNTGGSSLTIENTSTAAATAAIWLSSLGAGNGATNNQILNCNIKAGVAQNTATTNTYGIVMAGATLTATHTTIAAGDDNDNNTISGNTITKVRYGIYSRGGGITNPNLNTQITNNIIGSASFGPDEIGKGGIHVREEEGVIITGNTVQSIGGDFNNTTAGADRVGITLGVDVSWTTTSVYVKNAVVTNNRIINVVDERTFSAVGIAITAADGTNPTNNLIANNMIAGINANGTGGDQAIGIGISASNSDKIVYNSIQLSGDTDPNGSATTPTTSNFGISISSGTAVTNPTIANNIVVMDLSSSSATSLLSACINVPTAFAWGTGSSNYNDLYYNSANTQTRTGCVGGSGGTFHLALADWQTAVTQDANSVAIAPVFTSLTDLHLPPASNISLNNLGTPIMGVTTDIDGETRNATSPDLGCDEYSPLVCTGTPNAGIITPASATICSGSSYLISATSLSTGTGISYQWKTGPSGGPYLPVTAGLGTTTPNYTTDELAAGAYYYIIETTCSNSGLSSQSNEMAITVNATPTASISPTGLTEICDGESQVYTATTDIGNVFSWKRNGLVIPGEILNTYTATMSGTYQVVVSNSVSTCKDSSAIVALSISPKPAAVSILASSTSICSGTVSTLDATGGLLNYLNSNSRLAINKLIPDNATDTLRDTIIVAGMPASGNLDSIIVTLNITHPFVSDLDIYLRAPNGNTLELSTDNGSTGDNYTNTRLTTLSTAPDITLASAPFTGTFRAEGYLSMSNLESVLNGNWQLLVFDDFADDQGTLTNWSLKLVSTGQAPITWSPTTGLFTNAGATVAYTGGPASTVYASPGSTINYTATATSPLGCTATSSVSIEVTGDEVMNENNAGTGSLRKAIECTAAGDTVFVSSGSVNLINLLTQLNVDKPLLILDDNGSPVMLKFDFSSGALMTETNGGLRVGTMGNVTLDNIQIKHVGNDATHPVVKNEGILTLKNSKITGETGNTIPPVVQNAAGATINAEGTSEIKSE